MYRIWGRAYKGAEFIGSRKTQTNSPTNKHTNTHLYIFVQMIDICISQVNIITWQSKASAVIITVHCLALGVYVNKSENTCMMNN